MGICFTIDTPLEVAKYGISSVISLVDDKLMEKMRQYHSLKLNIPFQAISDKIEDCRAKRITAYLNLIDRIVKEKFEELKSSAFEKGSEIIKYLEMLPDHSNLKPEHKKLLQSNNDVEKERTRIRKNLSIGSIDVNIMTKLNKTNTNGKNEELPIEYNDAHAALRGFALSNLESSIIFSAGMNPRLYSSIEKFDDFYPDKNGFIKKKITLKVSDYRSAFIQSKFLAKKGLWVSEYRIESGLNCGGHAFATDGYLMGPILEEFKEKKETLIQTTYEMLVQSLKNKKRAYTATPPALKITAQGGVGTAEEHQFLMDHYQLDAIGWATPFLLVPEATTIDRKTRDILCNATEDDLYLSDISPLGVPFSNVKGNTKDLEKQELINRGRPGSPCPKEILVSNQEFTDRAICTASRQYQHLKLKELNSETLTPHELKKEHDAIVEKSCICVGLGTSALLEYHLDTKVEGKGVSVCPGPNLAYFSKTVSLKEMIDHIYKKINIIEKNDRPNMFIKELTMYVDFLKNKIGEAQKPFTEKQMRYFRSFQQNLNDGIAYYKELFANTGAIFQNLRAEIAMELEKIEFKLNHLTFPSPSHAPA